MFLGWVLEYGGVAPLYTCINSVVVFDYRYKLVNNQYFLQLMV